MSNREMNRLTYDVFYRMMELDRNFQRWVECDDRVHIGRITIPSLSPDRRKDALLEALLRSDGFTDDNGRSCSALPPLTKKSDLFIDGDGCWLEVGVDDEDRCPQFGLQLIEDGKRGQADVEMDDSKGLFGLLCEETSTRYVVSVRHFSTLAAAQAAMKMDFEGKNKILNFPKNSMAEDDQSYTEQEATSIIVRQETAFETDVFRWTIKKADPDATYCVVIKEDDPQGINKTSLIYAKSDREATQALTTDFIGKKSIMSFPPQRFTAEEDGDYTECSQTKAVVHMNGAVLSWEVQRITVEGAELL